MKQEHAASASPDAGTEQVKVQTLAPKIIGGIALPEIFSNISPSLLVIKFTCLCAAILGVVTLIAPWHHQPMDQRLGHFFPFGRWYGLTYVTDVNLSVTQWYTAQESMCRRSGEYARSQLSLKHAVLSKMAESSAQSSSSVASVARQAGLFFTCRYWESCQNAVYSRCTSFRVLAISLMVGLFFILFGTIIMALVFFITGGETDPKVIKVPAKQRAAKKTFLFVASGIGMQWFGYLVGFGMFDHAMVQLRKSAIYPYPTLFVGAYFAIASISCASIACACAIHRLQTVGQPTVSAKKNPKATPDAAAASAEEYYGQDWGEDGDYSGEWQEGWGNWWG